MKTLTFATIVGTGLLLLSLGMAAPALADDWDTTPVATGNDTSYYTAYRDGGPQGTPTPRVVAGGTGTTASGSAEGTDGEPGGQSVRATRPRPLMAAPQCGHIWT